MKRVGKRKRKAGRPTELTAELIRKIARAYRKNKLIVDALAATGVPERTLYRWKSGKGPLNDELRAALREAAKLFESDLATIVRKHCNKDPEFALQVLTRRVPKRWGTQKQKEEAADVNVNVGVKVDIAELRRAQMNDPEYLEFLRTRISQSNGHASANGAHALAGQVANGSPLNGSRPGLNGSGNGKH